MRYILFSLTFLYLTSCGTDPQKLEFDKNSQDVSRGIFNGLALSASTEPAVGAVLRLNAQNQVVGVCTGTLISEEFVLTAGHCVSDPLPNQAGVTPISASLLRFSLSSQSPFSVFPIKAVAIHPAYRLNRTEFSGYDVAVIQLQSPLIGFPSQFIYPLYQGQSQFNVSANSTYLGVGYGANSSSGTTNLGTGIKRGGSFFHSAFLSACANGIDTQCNGQPDSVLRSMIKVIPGASSQIACPGDSGGPLFYDFGGQRYLMGIASFVNASGVCASVTQAYYTSLETTYSWVNEITTSMFLKDSKEPNDSLATAIDIATFADAQGNASTDLTIHSANSGFYPNDEDWFKFTLLKTGTKSQKIVLEHLEGPVRFSSDLQMELRSSANEVLQTATLTASPIGMISLQGLAAGIYYVRVTTLGGLSEYNGLSFQLSDQFDRVSSNNTRETAVNVDSLSSDSDGLITISSKSKTLSSLNLYPITASHRDEDWFKHTLSSLGTSKDQIEISVPEAARNETGPIQVKIYFNEEVAPLTTMLLDPSTIASGSPVRVQYDMTGKPIGTYYIQVSTSVAVGESIPNYTLQIGSLSLWEVMMMLLLGVVCWKKKDQASDGILANAP